VNQAGKNYGESVILTPDFFFKNPLKMILHYNNYPAQGGFSRASAIQVPSHEKLMHEM
jgi:hypothetical protein